MSQKKTGAAPAPTDRPPENRQHEHSSTAKAIELFADCVFGPSDIVEVRLLPGKKSTWHQAADLPAQAARLAAANAKGQNIYVGANPRRQKGGTTGADVVLARCLFADFDKGANKEEARRRWEAAGLPEPTLLLHSGHGIHAYWLLAERLSDLTKWTALQRALILAVGSDPQIHDPPRIMRLPGFDNCKDEPRVPCRIIAADPSHRYTLATLLEAIGRAAAPAGDIASEEHSEPDRNASGLDKLARATAYLARIPGASEGERNAKAYRAACMLVKDFELTDADALALLVRWNTTNRPPLDDHELCEVLTNARQYAKEPTGNKLAVPVNNGRKPDEQGNDHEGERATEDPWPDPLADEAFHGVAGEIVRAIEPHSEADPVALLAQLLVGFGNLIGLEAHFRTEGDQHRAKLFCCLVGTTSKGRKGTSWSQVARVLKCVDQRWAETRVLSGLSSGEGLIWQVRDPIMKREPIRGKGKVITGYQDVEADAGVADKRLLVLESELGSVLRMLRRESNTLSPVVRDAWDKTSLRTLTKNNPAVATGCHISIIGHITRDELRRHLTETDMANGFANRFLWLCVRRSKCLPEGGSLEQSELEPLIRRVQDAAAFALECGELRRDEQAKTVWAAVYPKLSAGHPGLLGAATSRAEAQVMRLALIYALLDQAPRIEPAHLMAALALWEYAEASAKHIFGSAMGDPTADEILRALRATPDGMTRTALREHFGRHKSSEEIGRALAVLDECGLARSQQQPTDGRPAELWFSM